LVNSILEVKGLKKYFPIYNAGGVKQKGVFVKAIDGIDLSIREGETLGIVGESGSGKSTTAYNIVGMYGVTEGKILFRGKDISTITDNRPLRLKKDIQIVFQDPGTTLNPQRSIRQILRLPLQIHGMLNKKNEIAQIIRLLDSVELPPDFLYKYPTNIGGGERQMVAIARALATNPSIIILDEPTSALDVSIQAKIINMLLKLQKKFNLTYIFITHDLSLVRNFATRVAIMYLGKIAEISPTAQFFLVPKHPYTKMLLSSIPVISKEEEKLKQKKIKSQGEIPSPVNIPPGCSFNTRCPMAYDKCYKIDPVMKEVEPDHMVRCHLFG
jgi:peptide/nickel transport system ATP-binding protein